VSIYLIRHGETASNATRVVQTPDIPLNERGLAQAARLGERIAGDGIALVLVSDAERALMTARVIADATGAPLEIDPDLQERSFGDIRGTPYAELSFDLFALDYAPPNGETWDVFHARVDRVWERVVKRRAELAGTLAVVTHGLVCRSLAARRLGLDSARRAAVRAFQNSSLTVVEPVAPFRVGALDCCAHLTEDVAARGIAGI
jgi:broad specificity phosphatase PhoE